MDHLRTIDLGGVMRVTCRPLTSAAFAMIEAQGRAALADLHAAGGSGLDLDNLVIRAGLEQAFQVKGTIIACVVGWESLTPAMVLPDCAPSEVSRVFEHLPLLARDLHLRLLTPWIEREQEKNVFGPAPNGISAAGRDIAGTAPNPANPAPAG